MIGCFQFTAPQCIQIVNLVDNALSGQLSKWALSTHVRKGCINLIIYEFVSLTFVYPISSNISSNFQVQGTI